MKIIDGGVCAAKGFKAGSVRCGIKASRTNDDTAIIFSECECNAAATYTMNRVKAAPVYVTMEHLENGVARAIVANSGNANACAPDGMENARRMAKAAADFLGVDEEDVAVASTGVIGQRINIECIEKHLSEIVLSDDASGTGKPCNHDHRYPHQDGGGRVHGRRQDLPYRRHLQGQRHDSPEHGHHAVLHHD